MTNIQEADVVIVGGGITGIGIARDASMRGFKVILLERNKLGSGTSSYFHSILHSGARYAVVDPEAAKECYSENLILKRIVKDAILDTGGLFLAFSDEEIKFADTLLNACKSIGIPAEELSPGEVLRKEPKINPNLKRAFTVPAAHIDGNKTIELNKKLAEKHGTQIFTNCEVIGFVKENSRIKSVVARSEDGNEKTFNARYFINAAGIWATKIGNLAKVNVPLTGYKGSMVVFKEQFTRTYLNRCRLPADGDLLLPTGEEYIAGTTSIKTDDIDTHTVEQWEIDKILREAEEMIPGISKEKIERVYAGVRPIYTHPDEQISGRTESRSFKILNHKKEGLDNFISVVGGKFMIYRLMAEKAVDAMCADLKVDKICQTAQKEI